MDEIKQLPQPLILFDAECVFCCGWVRFLLREDHKKQFYFSSLESTAGHKIRQWLKEAPAQSVLLLSDGEVYSQSDAVLRIAGLLGMPCSLLSIGWVFPRFMRDALYRLIARNRFRLSGKNTHCFVPSETEKARFL
jgi:predicted DCC family thiol-disulfide oxidoreductase YuxK